jgi:dipeptidyl aminopeptidase/acylaminoacyl peptidase
MTQISLPKLKLYDLVFGIILMILILVLGILAYINVMIETNVNQVLLYGNQNQAQFANQQLQISFKTKAIQSESQKKSIEQSFWISPSATYSFTWVKNNLLVTFDSSLESDTEYKLSLQDVRNVFQYNFRTKSHQLAFLSKSYDESVVDKIFITNSKLEPPRIIFEYKNINFYAINQKYLVVGVNENTFISDKIYIKNLETEKVSSVEMADTIYTGVALANTSPELVILARNSLSSLNQIQKYSFDTETIQNFVELPTPHTLKNVQYSPKDSFLLFSDDLGNTFLQDTEATQKPELLGKFIDVVNPDTEETRLLAGAILDDNTNKIEYKIIDLETGNKKTILNQKDEFQIIDPYLLPTGDKVIYSAGVLDVSKYYTNYTLFSVDLKNDQPPTQILSTPGESYELSKVSRDSRFIAMEKSTQKSEVVSRVEREMGRVTNPKIVLWDLKNNTQVDNNIIGTNPVWMD